MFLSENDANSLRTALNMEYIDFVKAYCRWIPKGNGKFELSLREKSNYDCVFWNSKPNAGCAVYESRPLQCRAFPFWPSVISDKKSWNAAAKSCPGMGRGDLNSPDSIKKLLFMQQIEPIISRNGSFENSKCKEGL